MDEEEDDEDLFVYDPEQRRTVLASIPIPEGDVAVKLIFGCEMVADVVLRGPSQISRQGTMRAVLQ